MDEPMLYADLTFIINFIMDSIILWATSRLAGTPIILPRLFAGALIGALYSVIYLYSPDAVWYSLPAKICFSFIVVAIGLYPQNWQQFKKVLIYFYAISFAAAGASIAVSYLVLIPGQEFRFSYLWLLAGAVFVLLAGIFGEKYLIAKIVPSLLKFNVQIRIGSESCNGQGFLDTGNGLKDPLTDRPVVVAEYNLLRKCMPKDFQDIFDLVWNENDMLENLSRSSWANRLRIIPFSSIGKKNGILVGIRSDSIVVNTGRKDVIHNNVVVGIYKERLSHDGSYQLLIPSEIMNN